MTKHLSAHDVRELGVLLEVNRLLLHPRGLALALEWPEDADEARNHHGTLSIIDMRDDPEGFIFDDFNRDDVERADRFDGLAVAKRAARIAALGYQVQPLPVSLDDLFVPSENA